MDEKEKQLQTISNLENSIASNKKGMVIMLVMADVSFSIASYGWRFEKSFFDSHWWHCNIRIDLVILPVVQWYEENGKGSFFCQK